MLYDKNVRLALNLKDLDRIDGETVKLLSGRLDLQRPIRPDTEEIMVSGVRCGEHDETAVAFICELLAAALVADKIRAQDVQNGDVPTRVYIQRKKKGRWERLSGTVQLTERVRGKDRLSTKIFPVGVATSTVPSGISGVGL